MTDDERAEILGRVYEAQCQLLESGRQATIKAVAELSGLEFGTVNRAMYGQFCERLDRTVGSFRACFKCGGPITTEQSFGFEYGQPYHMSPRACEWFRLQKKNSTGRRRCGKSL